MDIGDAVADTTPRLREAMKHWDDALKRAAVEMEFITKNGIRALTQFDADYPQRLRECSDAPVILYYKGEADLNQCHVLNLVGTRHCTPYGQDLVRRFLSELRQMCPQVLVVSGLAYGIDICAHREALAHGFETVGVLAHGFDEIYPPRHRDTARQMLQQGGLLTEYMSQTRADKLNFVKRNRIVAGMCDATILVESASKGGGLITCSIAQDYGRSVFAFPGAVNAEYSMGCNQLIRNNGAELITSASDFIEAMGWQNDVLLQEAKSGGIERELFPNLSDDERRVVQLLSDRGDMQPNVLSLQANIPIGSLTALLFQLEMKGVVRQLAGGSYHLLR
jgi:DNA processing protein